MRSLAARALLALAVAATALVVAPAAPSYAAVTGSTSSGDVVLYDECQSHPVNYDLQLNGTTAYRLQLQVFDPNGFTSQGYVVNSASGGGPDGSFSVLFCGSEAPGTWTVKGTVCVSISCLTDLPGINVVLPDSTFEVRKAQTQTALRAKRLKRGGYKLIARVDREQPGGFAASQGVFVRFERQVGDEWQPIIRRRTSTVDGVATLRRGLSRGLRVRALVPDANNYSGSVSQTVRLKR